ncbi:hypothetical protein M8J75_013087 [Diaphorina citri]|nr:hypothetical protein M8J75_013087 [Diaphorina citri]
MSPRYSSCMCSQFFRHYVTAKQRSFSEPIKVKDEKKLMFERMGDELLEENIKKVKHKLLFNSYIWSGLDIPKSYIGKKKLINSKFSDSIRYDEIVQDKSIPISLKFLGSLGNHQDPDGLQSKGAGKENSTVPSEREEHEQNREKTPTATVFPYQINTTTGDVLEESKESDLSEEEDDFYEKPLEGSYTMRWMRDYEVYDESEEDDFDIDPSYFEYGTPDPSIPASTVPCGGCGAHLHCQDPSIPGYLPREIFSPCSKPDLKAIVCQRCHLMKNYNMALNVNVKPEDYEKLLQPIRRMKALVILIVDMTDFPCSIWPGILNVIGVKRPIFVVGNKIDAIPGDSKGWLKQAEQALRDALPTQANVLDVSFISAKTGYGIEELITKIYKIWELRGDVYLVGCTNVGKSTLFNAFLQSDLCKIKASDLISRATTSPWPGTTLNLLKFPIFKPTPHELQVRNVRLHERAKIDKQEKYLYEEQKRAFKWKDTGVKSLVGHIGRTFGAENTGGREAELSMSKIIHLLTTEELVATLPKSVIRPRVLHLRPGQTLFIAGLGRLDFVESTNDLSIRFAVMASNVLPLTACYMKDADEVYKSLLGTKAFHVPCGSSERMELWPALEGREVILVARPEPNIVSADLVLSSAGWVAVNMTPGQVAKFQCWTPGGRGIYIRNVPLHKYVHLMRGKKARDAPMYTMLESEEDEDEMEE